MSQLRHGLSLHQRVGSVAARIGLEHEYALARDGTPIDVRGLLPTLAVEGRRIDPGDRYAIRTPTGVALTADGREAEIATPPIVVAPGGMARLDAVADAGEQLLLGALVPGITVQAMSTHFNVGLATDLARRVAPMFARRFGVPLLLLTERTDADGLLVRPRVGRLELGTDYVTGAARRAAAVLAAGGVAACAWAAEGRRSASRLPPLLDLLLVPARERYGWYLDRRAAGTDLYGTGRATVLRVAGGGSITAQEQLVAAAACVRDALAELVSPLDLADLDALVDGLLPLAMELPIDRVPRPVSGGCAANEFGRALATHHRPGFECAAIVANWWVTIFVLAGVRRGYVVVPSGVLARFLDDMESGALDGEVSAFLADVPRGRTVRGWADVERLTGVAWCDSLPPRSAWVPPERDVAGALRTPPVAGVTTNLVPSVSDSPRWGKAVGVSAEVPLAAPPAQGPRSARLPAWGWLVVAGVLVGATLWAVGGGGSNAPANSTVPVIGTTATTSGVAATTSTTVAETTTTIARLVTGTYTGVVTVAADPAGHDCCVAPNTTWQVLQTRNTASGAITLTLGEIFPGVSATGEIAAIGAPVDLATTATIANCPGTEVRFQGTVTAEGGVVGTLTVGANGTLPTGQAIVFSVDLRQTVDGP